MSPPAQAPGRGSQFTIRLPALADGLATEEGPLEEQCRVAGSPRRVLVVDDNVDSVFSFLILLKASGHDVRSAHDGPTAVQAALDYRPDVALLDIGLPGLNGSEVAKRIRQHPVLKDIVLIALTGYGQDSDRQASMQAGFNHHLTKPIDPGELMAAMAALAKRTHDRD